MRVCVVGAGAREHALARALSKSATVVVTPGNPGTGRDFENASESPEEIDADLFVIGPEVPLVDGLADRLRARGRLVVGPGRDGARLEGSKAWMKEVLARAAIPSARFESFGADEVPQAISFLKSLGAPYVIKTDGLAGGKGVLVTPDLDEAIYDLEGKLSGETFGTAGTRVVVEEFLDGPELSVMALCDGSRVFGLQPAQDYKRVGDNNLGPNTGGMGAYSPVALATPQLVDEVIKSAFEPLVREFNVLGIDYRGILYGGLIITSAGPKILEFNIRLGDPETQVVLPLMANDLTTILLEVAQGNLKTWPEFLDQACVGVVMASKGYPQGPLDIGGTIVGIEAAEEDDGVSVLHAGTTVDSWGNLVSNSGRVLNVTAIGRDLVEARRRAYQAVAKITWPGVHFRSDIASF